MNTFLLNSIYHNTQEAVIAAIKWAQENEQSAIVYRSNCAYKIGRLQAIPAYLKDRKNTSERPLSGNGAEIFWHNVIYRVYPCGSVWDYRMEMGIGPRWMVA